MNGIAINRLPIGSLFSLLYSMLPRLKRNLGTHQVKDLENVRDSIREILEAEGYDVKHCDICSVDITRLDEKDAYYPTVHVLFKFVHYKVPTMLTEPYWLITLSTAESPLLWK